jgi:ParB-like chromosome segregation protein Spo0J
MDDTVVWLDLEDLRSGFWPRSRGLDSSHVAALAELEGQWPPILVRREDFSVIDGNHRVAAARSIGQGRVAAVLFEGTSDEAWCEAIHRNTQHGLPLRLDDRRRAAQELLTKCPAWSDRHIAEICGLAPGTVGRLRLTSGTGLPHGPQRVGRDGRLRPVRSESNHQRILDAIRAHPQSSLRAIAHEVGTSAETVRRVRRKLCEVGQDASEPERTASSAGNVVTLTWPQPQTEPGYVPPPTDPALASTPEGSLVASWLDRTDVQDDWQIHVLAVPFSRVYEVADEARRRARSWNQFADALERRARIRPAAESG